MSTDTKQRSPFTDGFERDAKTLLLCYDASYRAITRAELRRNLRRLGVDLDEEPGPRALRLRLVEEMQQAPEPPATSDEPLTDEEIDAIAELDFAQQGEPALAE